MTPAEAWRARLDAARLAGHFRQLREVIPDGPVHGWVDGQRMLLACSNDYLGLAADPDLAAMARGGGVGSSRLISGQRPAHRQLEEALEDWLGLPALLFPSGYQANVAAWSTLPLPEDLVASDQLNHASLIDGLRLSRARRHVFPHARWDQVPAEARWVVLESLYSMDGDVADLSALPSGPWRGVDEAHALGCLGPEGRGLTTGQRREVVIGTFGKALGGAGAFVAGPAPLRELLINAARGFIFSTGPAEPMVRHALAALWRVRSDPEPAARLARNAAGLRRRLTGLGWRVLGAHHILPIVTGPSAVERAQQLARRGVFVPAIRWPTVPRGQERLRFTVSAAHREEDLDFIAEALGPAPETRDPSSQGAPDDP